MESESSCGTGPQWSGSSISTGDAETTDTSCIERLERCVGYSVPSLARFRRGNQQVLSTACADHIVQMFISTLETVDTENANDMQNAP